MKRHSNNYFKDIKKILKETAEAQKKFEIEQKQLLEAQKQFQMEDEKRAAYIAQLDIEIKAKAKELDEEMKARDAEYKARQDARDAEYKANFEAQKAESDKKTEALRAFIEETSRVAKETSIQFKKHQKEYGNRINNHARAVEDIFYNSFQKSKTFAGIKFDRVQQSFKIENGIIFGEIDIAMFNHKAVALIETKTTAHVNDLIELIQKKLPIFREKCTEYADYDVYLGIASNTFYEDLEKLAHSYGVATIKQVGDLIMIDAENLKTY